LRRDATSAGATSAPQEFYPPERLLGHLQHHRSTQTQTAAVIDAGIIPPLVAILQKDKWVVQKDAAWAISKAACGCSEEQICYLAQQGVIPRLCALLSCPISRITLSVLEGVERILHVGQADGERAGEHRSRSQYAAQVLQCGGVPLLRSLQQHEEADVAAMASSILATHFGAADEGKE